MRLVTFEVRTDIGPVQRIGILKKDEITDLNMGYVRYLKEKLGSKKAYEIAAAIVPPDMLGFLASEKEGIEAMQTTTEYVTELLAKGPILGPRGERIIYGLKEVKIKAPVPRPHSIRDYLCFAEHASKSGTRQLSPFWYKMPVCYKGNPDSVIGPEEVIPWPRYSDFLDFELEYGIYIGKEGRNIPREKAQEYIAGYTIFNDVSARDIQMEEMDAKLGPVKGKDFCSVMGPCLATPGEINPQNTRMIARINGEVWSDNNSGTSYWTWEQIIEFASMEETLHPGDFLGSGTVGKGCGSELGRYLNPGDIVELEVEGIGILRNKVGEKPAFRRVFVR